MANGKWQMAKSRTRGDEIGLGAPIAIEKSGPRAHGGAKTKTQDRGGNYALFAAAAADAAWAACANLLTNFSLIRADLPLRLRK